MEAERAERAERDEEIARIRQRLSILDPLPVSLSAPSAPLEPLCPPVRGQHGHIYVYNRVGDEFSRQHTLVPGVLVRATRSTRKGHSVVVTKILSPRYVSLSRGVFFRSEWLDVVYFSI